MRFRRTPRSEPYRETSRKRAAFLRKQRLEREALPLFAKAIAHGQHGVDEEMARRTVWWGEAERARRAQRAAGWRRARVRLFALDAALRHTIRALWRTCPYPADPSYFADLLHQIAVGRVDPHRPPWVFHAPTQARTMPNPASFGDAFRQIGKRQAGGGPKTTPADVLTFCGNLSAGILFLISRVRLIEPNESFYTSSNHRLRDSHVGRSGHWVEIEVRGPCSDADLALIERLAQAADTRPVAVHRPDPEPIPAIERYDGPLWRTLRATDPDRRFARVAVLSARYGFRDAATPIADYDARLTGELAARMIAGGVTTRWPRPSSPRRPDTAGVHAGTEIAGLARYGAEPFEEIALVGGQLYLEVVQALLAGFLCMGCIRQNARVSVINGPIGLMRRDLRLWLRANDSLRGGRP